MTNKRTPTQNRETWLNRMTAKMKPAFKRAGAPIPDNIRVSIGFPKGRRGSKKGGFAIGQCWHQLCSDGNVFEIFIHPEMADSMRVADILAHELVHAAVGIEAGHGPKFRKVALAIGLVGPMTATTAGPEFIKWVQPIIDKLGPIPHDRLNAGDGTIQRTGPKKQGTRMIKVECESCGFIARTTRSWLDRIGPPLCACNGSQMTEA